MAEFYEVADGRRIRVGTKLEIWDGTADDEDRDWGEVTRLLSGGRVAVYWYGDKDTFISDVGEISALCVGDWSPETYDILRERAREAGHGQA